MNKISAVYKITNTITGDFYIGSSNNVERRWKEHKYPSIWKRYPNSQLYLNMRKYGVDKFEFEILAEVEADSLKETEQQFIELLKPTYNSNNADGLNIERSKKYKKQYQKTDKYKEYMNEYQKSDKYKEYMKQYQKTDKGKESQKKANKKYKSQLCCYNGETITLNALSKRFRRMGLSNPTAEAKKYLIINTCKQ